MLTNKTTESKGFPPPHTHFPHFKCNLHNSQTIFPTVEEQENVQHSNANILGILWTDRTYEQTWFNEEKFKDGGILKN